MKSSDHYELIGVVLYSGPNPYEQMGRLKENAGPGHFTVVCPRQKCWMQYDDQSPNAAKKLYDHSKTYPTLIIYSRIEVE